MKKAILTVITFLLFMGSLSHAQDVTLSWDSSPSSSVTGYYVHYQKDDNTTPFSGTGAEEGDSPIDVEDNLTTTLTGLPDGDYYFAVTAYDDNGNESSYSNIVSNASSSTRVNLLFPADNTTDEPTITSFEWEGLDSSYDVYYKLVYGSNESEVSEATNITTYPLTPVGPGSGLLLLLATGIILLGTSSKKTIRWAALALCSVALLNSCGGGGSSSDNSSASKTITSTSDESVLTIVDTGSDDFYDVDDLDYSTTYFWKVIAVDNSDATVFYESDVYQFTTDSE
jgi:hypothetical protein